MPSRPVRERGARIETSEVKVLAFGLRGRPVRERGARIETVDNGERG